MNRRSNGPKKVSAGAAWIKQSPQGSEYISITFNQEVVGNLDLSQCWINLYVNDYKQKPSQPDYNVQVKPKQQRQQQAPRHAPGQHADEYWSNPQPPQQQQQMPMRTPRPQNFAPQAPRAPVNAVQRMQQVVQQRQAPQKQQGDFPPGFSDPEPGDTQDVPDWVNDPSDPGY